VSGKNPDWIEAPYEMHVFMQKTFICDCCKRPFNSISEEGQAELEMKDNFGDIPNSERALVCDECYERAMEIYRKRKPE
jgi:hypothetical protein